MLITMLLMDDALERDLTLNLKAIPKLQFENGNLNVLSTLDEYFHGHLSISKWLMSLVPEAPVFLKVCCSLSWELRESAPLKPMSFQKAKYRFGSITFSMSTVRLNLGGLNYSFALQFLFFFMPYWGSFLNYLQGTGLTAFIPVSKDISYFCVRRQAPLLQALFYVTDLERGTSNSV